MNPVLPAPNRQLGLFVFCCQVVWSKSLVMRPDLFSSPCPDTFRYQMDPNTGDIYGTIGVYSFDENVVQLSVDLSVANNVNNYNGRIELAYPKEQVIHDIARRRPIRYKLFFPRWENIPPKITKIAVNGQVVCTGPQISGGWVRILTNINLQHTLTVKTVPLQAKGNPFINPSGNGNNNPFVDASKNYNFDFRPQDSKDGFLDNPFISLSTSTTTERITSNSIPASDFLYSKNPFLNGNGPVLQVVPKTSSPRPTTDPPKPSRAIGERTYNDVCGSPVVPVPLVVNGGAVPRGAFPWLVAMFEVTSTGLEYQCSGSLISKKHVVTAAHCVERGRKRIRADRLVFVLGKHNIKRWGLSEGEKMIEAEDIKVHPDYKPLTADADLAVAILSEEVQFTRYIRPICLWTENDDLEAVVGEKGKVVGWGRDENNNTMTAEPKQTTVPIVSQEQCLWSAEAFRFVTSSRTFCAGQRDGSGPCYGDSGSGFVMKRNGRWVLRGVVSISTYDESNQTCDLANYVVFTDVSKFKEWLFTFLI